MKAIAILALWLFWGFDHFQELGDSGDLGCLGGLGYTTDVRGLSCTILSVINRPGVTGAVLQTALSLIQ